ncbi:MAG: hypothetical protein KAH18_10100 [Psychromonas sp.]|nr:hypothetical protein [Psychromonas sp.]
MIEPLQNDNIYDAVQQANLQRQDDRRCTYLKAKLYSVSKQSCRYGNERSGYSYISNSEFNQLELMQIRHALRSIANVIAVIIKMVNSLPKSLYTCKHDESMGIIHTGKFLINDDDIITIRRVFELLSCPTRNIVPVDRRKDFIPSTLVNTNPWVGGELQLYNQEVLKFKKAHLSEVPVYVHGCFHLPADNFTRMKILYPSVVATALAEVSCITMPDGSSFFAQPIQHFTAILIDTTDIFESMAEYLMMNE